MTNAGILRGDTNCDGQLTQSDFDTLVAALFEGEGNGTCPGLDVNGDGMISAADAVALVEILPPEPTPTPTHTPTNTPLGQTPGASATRTASAVTPTVTRTATRSATTTPSATATAAGTATVTATMPTATQTRTPSITGTPTNTPRPTNTGTVTRTGTSTRTPTVTLTPSRTATVGSPTVTRTASRTATVPTATRTGTITRTPTDTRTATITRTPSLTRTPSVTTTASSTRTPSRTATATRSVTATRTLTVPPSPTITRTFTAPPSPSLTRTVTRTPTSTMTRTVTRTATPTIPRPFGPEVLFFGIATADNRVRTPNAQTEDGVPIYDFPNRFGFILVVEGRPGTSNRPLAQCGTMGMGVGCGNGPAAVQIIANRPLGNGSQAVCDTALPNIGGVPAVASLSFDGSAAVINAINDLACRLDIHNTTQTACTFDELNNFRFVRAQTTLQYCSAPVVGADIAFPRGLTRLKAQLQDSSGNIGNQVQIAIRIP